MEILCTARFYIKQYEYCFTGYLWVWYDSHNEKNIFLYSAVAYSFYNHDVKCLLRDTDWLYRSQCNLISKEKVPWLRLFVVVLWKLRLGFSSKTFHLGYVVDKMWKYNRLFLSVLRFYPVSNIPHTLYTLLHLMSLAPEEQTVMAWKLSKRNDGLHV